MTASARKPAARKSTARKTPATRKPGGPVSRAEFSELVKRVADIEAVIAASQRHKEIQAAKQLAATPGAVEKMRQLLDLAESQSSAAAAMGEA